MTRLQTEQTSAGAQFGHSRVTGNIWGPRAGLQQNTGQQSSLGIMTSWASRNPWLVFGVAIAAGVLLASLLATRLAGEG